MVETTSVDVPEIPASIDSEPLTEMSIPGAIQKSIFLASLGNPAPYAHTLHSAGHIALDALANHLGLAPFKSHPKIRPGHSTSTTVSTGPTSSSLTLWKCPSQMNISGAPLRSAWTSYLSTLPPAERTSALLYIVHDDLDLALGKIRTKTTGSPRGHNGLKSVIQAFGGRQDGFTRIGIGIGRPPEGTREKVDVSRWVLRRTTAAEENAIRGSVGEIVGILGIE